MKTAKSKSKSKTAMQGQTDENKGAKNANRQLDKKSGVNESIKIVYTVNAKKNQQQSKEGNEGVKETKSVIVNQINLGKKKTGKANGSKLKEQSKLSEVLERIYNKYNKKKDLNWIKAFKEEIINDTNFSFDYKTLIVKSLNKQSSELFDREMLWMLIVEYYINEAKCNKEMSILNEVVRLFDQGLNFITEPKNIMQFYYSTIATLFPQLKKEEMLNLLNANSKFLLDQEPIGKRPKVLKKLVMETNNDKKAKVNLIEVNEQMEFIPIAANINNETDIVNVNANANVNMTDLVNTNANKEEEEIEDINSSNAEDTTLDEKCLSTICNASSTVEYQHWLSPQLTHIKEEESEEKDKDKTKQKDYIPYNATYNELEDEIIPHYEQRKHLKVKELMREIEGKMHSTDISQSTELLHPIPLTGNKRSTATPSKIRFSPREEYPMDIVEGSIQKFNRSFTKN